MKKILTTLVIAVSLYAAENNQTNLDNKQNPEITSQYILGTMNGPLIGTSMSCNMDIDFLSDVLPQYRGSVDSSKLYIEVAKNENLKKVANDIIKNKEEDINHFNNLIDALSKEGKKDCDKKDYETFQTEMQNAMDTTMQKISEIKATNSIDNDYARGMIEHHEGSVRMAKVILKFTKNPDVKKVADDIIKSQDAQIKTIQDSIK